MFASLRLCRRLLVAVLGTACVGRSAARGEPPMRPPPASRDTAGHPLRGRVRDSRSDAPVAGAVVLLLADTAAGAPPLRAGRTDAQGWYRLAGAPAGGYVLRVQHLGYFGTASPVQLGDCGEVVAPTPAAGAAVSSCGDTHHIYLRPSTRF